MNDVSVVIPVAGVGTRLKPHTFSNPKALLRVGDKSIIGRILDQLIRLGLKKVYLIIGHLGELIQAHINDNYPELDIEYISQTEYRGLGHAIFLSRGKVKGGPILIILGDAIIEADYGRALSQEISWMGVQEVDDPRRFGIVEEKGGCITRLVEKPEHPTSNLAIVGLYYFKESSLLFSSLEKLIKTDKTTKGEYQLTDAIQMMVESGEKIKPFHIDTWHDCGKPETLLATNRHILKKHFIEQVPIKNNTVISPSYVSPTAKIDNSVIGPFATIGEHVKVSNAVISDSIINDYAEVRNIVLSKSLLGHSASVTGSKQKLNVGDNSEIHFE
jgi:glucose-1-phosphate thymidylyltransferase